MCEYYDFPVSFREVPHRGCHSHLRQNSLLEEFNFGNGFSAVKHPNKKTII